MNASDKFFPDDDREELRQVADTNFKLYNDLLVDLCGILGLEYELVCSPEVIEEVRKLKERSK